MASQWAFYRLCFMRIVGLGEIDLQILEQRGISLMNVASANSTTNPVHWFETPTFPLEIP